MKHKKNVAVIFGGQSVEHDVSIITAHTPIINSLQASGKFEVVPIYIAKDGSWYSSPAMNDIEYFRKSDLEGRLRKLKKVRLLFGGGIASSLTRVVPRNDIISVIARKFYEVKRSKTDEAISSGLKIIKSAGWIPASAGMAKKIDVVFPAMHGTHGEDGSLMGLLRMANVPFVGCDLFASAIAMDKALTKQVVMAEGLPIVPYVWFIKGEIASATERLRNDGRPRFPLFVKPVHLGSSIGMAKVKNEEELKNAIEVAFHYDDKVLVEESIEDLTEVTLPIMGNDNELRLGAIERPLNKTDFFNFQDKYLSSGKKGGGKNESGVNSGYSELPAKISEELAERVKELGKKTYRALGCSGIARIDFLIDNSANKIYVNEVNTLPGSLYHHNWKSVGVSGVELVTELIKLAEERFQKKQKITNTFKSEVLRG